MSRARRYLAAALLALPLAAWGQACNLQDIEKLVQALGSYDDALIAIKERRCLGDKEKDDHPLVQDFDKRIEASNAAVERHANSVAILNELARYAAERSKDRARTEEDWLAIARAMEQSARTLAQAAGLSQAEAIKTAERAIPRSWERIATDTQGELLFEGRRVRLLAPTGCAQSAPSCQGFEIQRDMIRVVNLAARLRDVTQRESLALHLADARLELERWDAYRSKAHHQYFWEVWANGMRMGEDLCPTDPKTGIQIGFCKVPTDQWIILHPDAGLRWSRHASRSGELRPAFLVEVLGYYRWDWRAPDSAAMTDRLGASLVAAYTDEPTGEKWSWGPMIYFGDGYNLAATRAGGGKWSLVLNVKLADRYFERRQKYTDYLKALKKSEWGALLD